MAEGFKGAYLMRDTADPDQITVMGLFDVSDDDAARMQTDLEPSERDRHERMAPHVADTLVSGLFDIVVHERAARRATTRRCFSPSEP